MSSTYFSVLSLIFIFELIKNNYKCNLPTYCKLQLLLTRSINDKGDLKFTNTTSWQHDNLGGIMIQCTQ